MQSSEEITFVQITLPLFKTSSKLPRQTTSHQRFSFYSDRHFPQALPPFILLDSHRPAHHSWHCRHTQELREPSPSKRTRDVREMTWTKKRSGLPVPVQATQNSGVKAAHREGESSRFTRLLTTFPLVSVCVQAHARAHTHTLTH